MRRVWLDAAIDHVAFACAWIVVGLSMFGTLVVLLPRTAPPAHRVDRLFTAPKIGLRAAALGKPTAEAAR